jgi:uncharacterized protein YbbK (DUF523 family)
MMEKVLVSACLLGAPVRYHGGDAACSHPILRRWMQEGRVIPVCPEQEGGLPTPRPAAEIAAPRPERGSFAPSRLPSDAAGGHAVIAGTASVRTITGGDVTLQFCRGASRALELVQQHGIRMALLKEGSPSCASTVVFDGSFSGTRVAGVGVTTALLNAHGVRVFSENEIERAQQCLDQLEAFRR